MGTLLLASEMPVPIPRCSTVLNSTSKLVRGKLEIRSNPQKETILDLNLKPKDRTSNNTFWMKVSVSSWDMAVGGGLNEDPTRGGLESLKRQVSNGNVT